MALTLFVRSLCKVNCSPILSNVARMSYAASVPTFQNGLATYSSGQLAQNNLLASPLPIASTVGNKFVHRVTAADGASASPGHHDKLWTAERALSAALLGILPVGMMFPSQPTDALMAISIVMHQYWGLEAIVTDYVRPLIFGDIVPKLAHGLLILITATTLGGLFYFIYNDIGIAKSIRKLWSIKGQ